MISHWDDVPWERHEHGELRCERQSLSRGARQRGRRRSAATGSRPGDRSMPLHVHVDEEEIFFVLAGRGLSWQDDAVHEVARRRRRSSTSPTASRTRCVAGDADGPLDVLAFASGSATRLTLLPRAGVAWVGARWLPPDAPHPFSAEPPLAAASCRRRAPRPPTIVALDDVEAARCRTAARCTARAATSAAPPARGAPACSTSRSTPGAALLGAPLPLARGGAVRRARRRRARCCSATSAHPVRRGLGRRAPARDRRRALLRGRRRRPRRCSPTARATRRRRAGTRTRARSASRGLGVICRVEPLDYWDGEE